MIRLVTQASHVHQWRTPFPVLCGLLEGMRELKHAPVVMVAPDDLDTHGQSARGEPAGY
jgi:hypothetical protein